MHTFYCTGGPQEDRDEAIRLEAELWRPLPALALQGIVPKTDADALRDSKLCELGQLAQKAGLQPRGR